VLAEPCAASAAEDNGFHFSVYRWRNFTAFKKMIVRIFPPKGLEILPPIQGDECLFNAIAIGVRNQRLILLNTIERALAIE
jgi:hypothetical protein